MAKDTYLINIYLKILNKKNLTMDDLRYLAEYDPECFQKTCKNVVYNFPESKPIMEPEAPGTEIAEHHQQLSETQIIQKILANLKELEVNNYLFTNVQADKVKTLLGNLYLELLFPHNDKDMFMNLMESENTSSFDAKI